MKENTNPLIIPSKHLVGTRKDQGEKVPTGFMIPWDENPTSAMKKRKETVDSWLGEYGRKNGKIEIYDNKPFTGINFTDISRRYRTNNAFLRVTDPRGFELEISIENFFWMMERITIKNAVIQDELIWGKWKSKGENILVPTSAPEYLEAMSFTKKLSEPKSFIGKTQAKIGGVYKLTSNEEVRYLGEFHVRVRHNITRYASRYYYGPSSKVRDENFDTYHVSDKKFYVTYQRYEYPHSKAVFWYFNVYASFPKFIDVVSENNTMSQEAAMKFVNEKLKDKSDRSSLSRAGSGKIVPFPEKSKEHSSEYHYEELIGLQLTP